MKRGVVLGLAAGIGLLGGLAYLVAAPPSVSTEAIQTSVIRTPELVDQAWQLPVATTFKTDVD